MRIVAVEIKNPLLLSVKPFATDVASAGWCKSLLLVTLTLYVMNGRQGFEEKAKAANSRKA